MNETLQHREVSVSEQATTAVQREEWQNGRNGGRLRTAGTGHGPRRETAIVKKALVEALRDPRGGACKEFFVGLKTGTAEDRRCFANVVTKLIPVEVQGDLGEALTVVINTLVAAPNGGTPLAPARLESTSPNDAPSVNVQPTVLATVPEGETR